MVTWPSIFRLRSCVALDMWAAASFLFVPEQRPRLSAIQLVRGRGWEGCREARAPTVGTTMGTPACDGPHHIGTVRTLHLDLCICHVGTPISKEKVPTVPNTMRAIKTGGVHCGVHCGRADSPFAPSEPMQVAIPRCGAPRFRCQAPTPPCLMQTGAGCT